MGVGAYKRRAKNFKHVSFEEVEKFQERFELSNLEMAYLMKISPNSFYRWRARGIIPVLRFYAAKDAIKSYAISEILAVVHKYEIE